MEIRGLVNIEVALCARGSKISSAECDAKYDRASAAKLYKFWQGLKPIGEAKRKTIVECMAVSRWRL
jgi:hypothetical protein